MWDSHEFSGTEAVATALEGIDKSVSKRPACTKPNRGLRDAEGPHVRRFAKLNCLLYPTDTTQEAALLRLATALSYRTASEIARHQTEWASTGEAVRASGSPVVRAWRFALLQNPCS